MKIAEFFKNPKKRALVGAIIFAIIAAAAIVAPSVRSSGRQANAKEILGDKYGTVTVMWKQDAPWFEITDSGKIYFYFTRYKGDGTVEIPYMFDGVVVTAIADDCFAGARDITKVIIPESVKSIGGWAFDGCTSLQTVQLSEGLITIGNWAFANCTSLAEISLPKSLTALGRYVFQNCTSLSEIRISENVTTVKNGVFSGCISLERIDVDIKNKSFVSLDGVLFDAKATVLYAFPCGRSGKYTVPDGVKSIYLDAFRGAALSALALPQGLSEIGEYAFAECANLEEIKITGSVSEVPTGAFSGCESLKSIYLPESVSSIGMGAFYGCDSLKTLTYGGTAEKWSAAKKAVNNGALESARAIFEK